MERSTFSFSISTSRISAIAVQPLDRLEYLQQFLLFLYRNLEIRGNRVGKLAGIIDAHRGDHRVVIQALRELHVLLEKSGHALGGLLVCGPGSAFSGTSLSEARKNPSSLVTCTIFARSVPSTSTFILPSGSLTLCTMLASVPT